MSLDISWWQTIIGILVGWQLPNIVNILKFWLYLRWKEHFLEGDWNCYHYSFENNVRVFRHEIWTVSRNKLGGLLILTNDDQRPRLIYKAKVQYEKGYLLLNFKGLKHPEEWQARLNEVIPSSNSQMRGFMVALDFDRNAYATPLLVSEKSIEIEEAQNILRTNSFFDEEAFSMRLRGNPSKNQRLSDAEQDA